MHMALKGLHRNHVTDTVSNFALFVIHIRYINKPLASVFSRDELSHGNRFFQDLMQDQAVGPQNSGSPAQELVYGNTNVTVIGKLLQDIGHAGAEAVS